MKKYLVFLVTIFCIHYLWLRSLVKFAQPFELAVYFIFSFILVAIPFLRYLKSIRSRIVFGIIDAITATCLASIIYYVHADGSLHGLYRLRNSGEGVIDFLTMRVFDALVCGGIIVGNFYIDVLYKIVTMKRTN
jgi:hypothetical protein